MQPCTASHWQIGGLPLPPVACHGLEPLICLWSCRHQSCIVLRLLLDCPVVQRRTSQIKTCQLVLRQRRLFANSDAIAAVAVHVQPHQGVVHALAPSHVTSTRVAFQQSTLSNLFLPVLPTLHLRSVF